MKSLLLFLALVTASFAAEINLKTVEIATRVRPLTNCVVKKVTPNGITFLCDQGMIQVPFKDLPPEFAAYKVADSPRVQPVVESPKPIAPTATKKAPKPKTELELATEARDREILRNNLTAKIAQCEAKIAKYDKQSSFSKDKLISDAEIAVTRAELDDARAKLAQLPSR